MAFETKDYVTSIVSSAALAVSLFNAWRAARESRAANTRACEQKRFEAMVAIADARRSTRQAISTLEAVRFEARKQQDVQVVAAIDKQIGDLEAALDRMMKHEQGIRTAPPCTGEAQEGIAMERLLGTCKAEAANASDEAVGISRLAETIRQKLVASLMAQGKNVP